MGDIETYRSETYLSMLVGEASTAKLTKIPSVQESMNIDRAVQLKLAAYNRYKGLE